MKKILVLSALILGLTAATYAQDQKEIKELVKKQVTIVVQLLEQKVPIENINIAGYDVVAQRTTMESPNKPNSIAIYYYKDGHKNLYIGLVYDLMDVGANGWGESNKNSIDCDGVAADTPGFSPCFADWSKEDQSRYLLFYYEALKHWAAVLETR